MKSFTLASFAVIAALYTVTSAYAAPKVECQAYQGNWVNAPATLCSAPDVGGGHGPQQTGSVSHVSTDK